MTEKALTINFHQKNSSDMKFENTCRFKMKRNDNKRDIKSFFAEVPVVIFLFAMIPIAYALGYLTFWGITEIPNPLESFALLYRSLLRYLDFNSPMLLIISTGLYVAILSIKKVKACIKKVEIVWQIVLLICIVSLSIAFFPEFFNYRNLEYSKLLSLLDGLSRIPNYLNFILIIPMILGTTLFILLLQREENIINKTRILFVITIFQSLIFIIALQYTENLVFELKLDSYPKELSEERNTRYLVWSTDSKRYYFSCRNGGEISVNHNGNKERYWYSSSVYSRKLCESGKGQ